MNKITNYPAFASEVHARSTNPIYHNIIKQKSRSTQEQVCRTQ